MYKLYYIVSPSTNGFYIGITGRSLRERFYLHKYSAKTSRTRLYCAMRKYKDFCIVLVKSFSSREACCEAEIEHIADAKGKGLKVYNHTSGGEVGFRVEKVDRESWIAKLVAARKGQTPALGMKHTEENKKLFSEFGKKRWDMYGRYPKDVTQYSFSEAKKLFGISKTHYYRLKRAELNELS